MSQDEDFHLNDDATRIQLLEKKNLTLQSDLSAVQTTRATGNSFGNISEAFLSSAPPLQIGSVIKDTFELVAILGEGGMGTVFKALNKVWAEVEARDPYVAIKILKPELSINRQLVRSLFSDFDRTKMLANCPNIIKVYGFDRDGPHIYMTMEFLEGRTLSEYLNRGPLKLEQAWFIIEGIGQALVYAHEHNIVHRDVKPGNIIITKENMVKVLDFGIASKINENEGDETKFGGHELGALTTAYASPEMQRYFPPDARDDIYAFACVIYEILTGKQFYKQKINKAAPIDGLNSRQMEILNKSLAFEREQRTASINELLTKLRPVKIPWLKYSALTTIIMISIGGVIYVISQITIPPKPPTNSSLTLPTSVAPILPTITSIPVHTVTPTTTVSITPVPTPPVIQHIATSHDGKVNLAISKAKFNKGEVFSLSFTLRVPMYVRIVDRDANGVVSELYPNSVQKAKLLAANATYTYPPKGFEAKAQGQGGESVITLIASAKPFAKNVSVLNNIGEISEVVQAEDLSWVQARYTIK